ncbi:MAG TPA: DNA/RNA non-specific endonuclease [Pyrinomonadaceae bacterium]|nr:DNA/RNA non-specific endonuclease [Pyrinomonadaceae bacterium]
MAAPPNEYAYDFEAVERAAEHWRDREQMRERNEELLKDNRFTAVESKKRLAQRANRLLDKVKTTVARSAQAEAAPEGLSEDLSEMVEMETITEDDVTDDLIERVIGETRDFLSVEFLEKGLMMNRSVARVVTNLSLGRRSFGTGFMVSPRLLLTNWHVLKTTESAAASTVEFDYQLDRLGNALTPQRFRLDPSTFFLNDKDLDFALVAVEQTSAQNRKLSEYGWCRLIKEEGKAILGNPVNIIQHPLGEMKQVIIRENKLKDLPPNPLDRFAHYEGDTEPGSSGSPVFNDQWEVIALHHSGVPKTDDNGKMIDVDGGVWKKGDDPGRLAWVANEGIRISRLMEFIDKAKVAPHEEPLRAQLMDPGVPPNPGTAKPPQEKEDNMDEKDESKNAQSGVTSGGTVTFTVPLNISISLGSLSNADINVSTVSTSPAEADLLEKITPDQNYDNRPGYDPDFLGFNVPLPTLGPSIRSLAVKVNDTDGNELKYYHYSVIMNGARRLAFVCAVNFEGDAQVNHPRDKDGDRWFFDPRIPTEKQVGEKLYSGNPLDRGHLVRRADAAWGDTKEDAKLANDDTFHFTNCSPQHEVFNQSTKANQKGILLWGNIEEHIASEGKANKERLAVFNGPVFRSNDKKHRGVGLPKEYWKVVVFKDDSGKPKALAFILSQASLIKNLPAEEFEVGPYQPFQVRIRDLEAKTKLEFGDLKDHDTLEDGANEGFFESGTEIVPIDKMDNIVY